MRLAQAKNLRKNSARILPLAKFSQNSCTGLFLCKFCRILLFYFILAQSDWQNSCIIQVEPWNWKRRLGVGGHVLVQVMLRTLDYLTINLNRHLSEPYDHNARPSQMDRHGNSAIRSNERMGR